MGQVQKILSLNTMTWFLMICSGLGHSLCNFNEKPESSIPAYPYFEQEKSGRG